MSSVMQIMKELKIPISDSKARALAIRMVKECVKINDGQSGRRIDEIDLTMLYSDEFKINLKTLQKPV